MHSNVTDLTGRVFGKLKVISYVRTTKGRHALWLCECECGGTAERLGITLRTGKSSSCGCFLVKHGMYKSKAYIAYHNMLSRCFNPNTPSFHRYGGRGITVCARWRESFDNFLADVGEPATPDLTLDRERNNENYEPGNVRWATPLTQAHNRATNRYVEFRGERLQLREAVEKYGLVGMEIVRGRLKLGWSVEDALRTRQLHFRKGT